MSEEFTLTLSVRGGEQIAQLTGLIRGLGDAGKGSEKKLSDVEKQTRAINKGFKDLATQFKASFGGLEQSITTLSASMGALEQKATKRVSGKSVGKQIAEDNNEAAISAKNLQRQLQETYDTKLVDARGVVAGVQTGRSPINATDLRLQAAQGAKLSPEDRVVLQVRKDLIAALEEYDRRVQTAGKAHAAALLENAAREQALGKAHAAALQENDQRVQTAGKAHAAALLENAAREQALGKAHAAAIVENAAREQTLGKAHAAALKEYDQRVQSNGKAHAAAILENAAREQTLGKAHAAALLENAAREQALGKAHAAALQENTNRIQTAGKAHAAAILENAARERAQARRADLIQDAESRYLDSDPDRQLAILDRVRRRLLRGGTSEEGLLSRFGPSALSAARNDAEYEAVARTSRAASESSGGIQKANKTIQDHTNSVMHAATAYGVLHTGLRGAAGAMGAIWLTWGKPLAALWAGFTAAAGLKQAIVQFTEFQNTLFTIGAIAGESDLAIQGLANSALAMSRESIRGPQELVDTLRVLTQAGLSAKDAMKVLPTVSDFATVGELKPEAAATSLIGISSAFGYTPSMMYKVADVVAKAAAISQTSIESMTAAVKVSSVVAEQFGAKIEDVSAILAVLAKRNIEASAAGTALRNAYTEVYTPSDKAREVMKQIGLSAYNANGSVKTFVQVMEDLAGIASKYDKKTQDRLFSVFFGERGGKVGSALLSDMRGLQEAMEKVGLASGFVDEAALRMEESLKNRATVAVNNLKASLIEAGAAAEGPLRQLADSLALTFKDPDFVNALKVLTEGFAQLVRVIVENGELIAKAFAVWFGARTIRGLFELGQGALAAAAAKRTAAASAVQAGVAAGALAEGSEKAAKSLGGTVEKLAVFGSLLGAGGTAIARFIPFVGLAIGGLELASLAWDKYREAQSKALKDLPIAGKSVSEIAAEQLRRTRERADTLEAEFEVRRLAKGRPSPPDLKAAQRAVVEAQRAFDSNLDAMNREEGDAKPGSRKLALAMSLAPLRARLNEAEAVLSEQEKEGRRLEEAETRLKRQIESEQTLGQGSLSAQFDNLSGRSYTSPLGTEQKNIKAVYDARYRALTEGYEREQKLAELKHRATLIDEDTFEREREDIMRRRLAAQLELANEYRDKILPQFQEDRIEDIKQRHGGDPKAFVEQMRAAGAEFFNLYTAANEQIASAIAQSGQYLEEQSINAEGRLKKAAADIDGVIRDALKRDSDRQADLQNFLEGGEEQFGAARGLAALRNKVNGVPEAVIEHEERKQAILKYYSKRIIEATNAERLDEVESLRRHQERMLDLNAEYAARKSEAERDPLAGIRGSSSRMLAEVENLADQYGSAWENAFSSTEDAFLNWVKTGKFSMRNLVDSWMQDIARIGFNQLVKGPMLRAFSQFFSGGLGGGSAGSLAGVSSVSDGAGGFVPVLHSGGLVGSAGALRRIDPAYFANARRYHSGGLVSDEVPIIARKGERVLTPEQNRNYEGGKPVQFVNNITVNGEVNRADLVNAINIAVDQAESRVINSFSRRGSGWRMTKG